MANVHNELDWRSANELLSLKLDSPDSFAAARMGSVEADLLYEFLESNYLDTSDKSVFSNWSLQRGIINAGIVGNEMTVRRFCAIYLGSLGFVDLIGSWAPAGDRRMESLLLRIMGDRHFTNIESLSPWLFLYNNPKAYHDAWPRKLSGKRVLIVHPFIESIADNISRKASIKTISQILPEFEPLFLMPPVTFAGNGSGMNWQQEFEQLTNKVSRLEFDICIIGCGSYGLPLAAFVKQMGRKAIHLGGATQLLFGIIGKRWESDEWYQMILRDIVDSSWSRPLPTEKPVQATHVEGACYW